MDDVARPYTTEEVLHAVALIQAHLAEDEEGVKALQDETEESARQCARSMFALAHVIIFGQVIPEMWVIKQNLDFGHTSRVPELNLAIHVLKRMEERIGLAHVHPVVGALSAGDVMDLIIQCTGTKMEDVPSFLDSVRERTLRTAHF
ncbi:DUF6224 family protein [Streptomyces litchfieldiae]|uniref:DUF6224 family protein n=1 Tax=Streptomyces litchfieldiae TaxID=3075543 RepID=A0ABU2MSW6_9ACTN|nr:DUF6224 family protein [Streptomyces sp. DSM 44938]MDT0344720.1 DUF6224 family protein [Streptomyces sp. DSM 44938]